MVDQDFGRPECVLVVQSETTAAVTTDLGAGTATTCNVRQSVEYCIYIVREPSKKNGGSAHCVQNDNKNAIIKKYSYIYNLTTKNNMQLFRWSGQIRS